MPESILFSPAPYHIVSYGTLLGTQFWHSFVNGIIAFKVLDRPQFSALQARLFPIYFTVQTAVPVLLVVTYPGSRAILGGPGSGASGFAGVLDSANRWTVLAPLATIFVTGLANMVVVGPATTKTMRDRKSQERKDGKKSYDPAPHSQEMIKLNKKFARLHGASSLLNLATFIATVIYGVTFSARIQ